MANVCKSCGRTRDNSRDEKTGKRKRSREHVCATVVIKRKKFDEATQKHPTKTVHEDRVAKGGDLYKLVNGRRAPWEVVYRNRQRIENIIEKGKAKKKKGPTLIAPSGEPLTAPTKGS